MILKLNKEKGFRISKMNKQQLVDEMNAECEEMEKAVEVMKEKKDGRGTAKKDEDIRVAWLCDEINTNTELGEKIKNDYYIKFDKVILYVEKKGGNNIHYDILIHHTDGTTNKCEDIGGHRNTRRLLMKIHLHMKILYNLEIFHVQNSLYLKNI